ncbi:hypothetical protein DH2020_015084 [Rehmannia glutinosa]|uniref:Uncharacterized protein n=1 Tax=Rehmannia glutinosa TaxID=99300 RepID=A0ABR0X1U7_REHGL
MEVCLPSNTPASQDISSDSGSSTDLINSTNYHSGYLSMNDLKICLTEFVSVEDIEISTSGFNLSPVDINKSNVVRQDECKDSDNRKNSNSASENYFSNRVTFPALAEPKSSVDGLLGEEKGHKDYKTSEVDESTIESVNQCYSQSISQPDATQTPLKPVSAMKGSREKQGTTPKQLSVTWAPDVYDPTPTAESHVPSSKNQRYRNDRKKHGKNKHKSGGKSSRGSKGKDKKQARKNGGGTTKLKPLQDDSVVVVGVSEPQVGSVDFNVVSPNAFCGSSFLKESVTNLHFPVTEAT